MKVMEERTFPCYHERDDHLSNPVAPMFILRYGIAAACCIQQLDLRPKYLGGKEITPCKGMQKKGEDSQNSKQVTAIEIEQRWRQKPSLNKK